MQKAKAATNTNFYGKEAAAAGPGQFTTMGQQPGAQELRQSKNQLGGLYKSLPRDADRLFMNPDADYMNQQFVSEYQKQQKNIKNIYGGAGNPSQSSQMLKVPKLKLKMDANAQETEYAQQAPSMGLPASAKAAKKQSLRLHGGAKPSQINSGRVVKNNQIQAYKPAGASSNEPPKRSSSNKLVKQQGIMHSNSGALQARKPQKTHKASSKQKQLVGPNSQHLHQEKTPKGQQNFVVSQTPQATQQQFNFALSSQQQYVPQTAQGSRQESADILYFQKNQMSAATALSSFNQQDNQQFANPMNSYAQSPFQPNSRRSTHQQPMYQTLQEPLRSQQHRHSAEPKLKNNKRAEYNLHQNQFHPEHQSQLAFSKRALTGRTQDDEVVYVPHQKSSYTRDSELQTDAKSSNSLSRLSRHQQATVPQMNNFVYDRQQQQDQAGEASGADFNGQFASQPAEARQGANDDAAQFAKFSQDLQKLQTSNMGMRELLQKAGIAVASLAKTSYLFKKQNKINLELQEAKEQDCRPDAQSTNSKSANSYLQLNQMIKLISLDINRINNSFNEVHFKMLENDDHLQSLLLSFQSLQSNSRTLSHILQLQNSQYKQQKEQKHIQNQLCTLLVENQRLKQIAKREEIQGQDRDTCQNMKIENLDEQLRESRKDNMILIQKVEQASKKLQSKDQSLKQLQQKNNALAKLLQSKQEEGQTKARSGSNSRKSARDPSKDRDSPQAVIYRNQIQKLVSQVQVFVEAMKNLQKLIGAKRTDASGAELAPDKAQVKLCKEKFEVSQKIMEQTIKQIKKENVDVFKNDQAAANLMNEEFTRRISKEKERVSQQRKQISELEANLQIEREKLHTYIQQNQVLSIKLEDLEQQIKARDSIQRATQHTQTPKKHQKDQWTQASRVEARTFVKETQTDRMIRRPSSLGVRISSESILPVMPTQAELLKNENAALVSQVERQECSLRILKEQIQAMSQTAQERCQDCLYFEDQLKVIKEKDIETKYLKLQDETMDLKAKLAQLENFEVPTLRTEKQKLSNKVDELTLAIEELRENLDEEHHKSKEINKVLKESQTKQSEICKNLDESSLRNEQLTQRLNESANQISQYKKAISEKELNDERLVRKMDALQERINSLTQDKVAQEQKVKEMQNKQERIAKENEGLARDKQQLANENQHLTQQKQQLAQELQSLKERLEGLRGEKEANERVIADQKLLLEKSISKSTGADADLNKFKAKIIELSDMLKKKETEMQTLAGQNQKATNDCKDLKAQTENQQKKIAELEPLLKDKELEAEQAREQLEELKLVHQKELQELKESDLKKVDALSHAKAKLQTEYNNLQLLQKATKERDEQTKKQADAIVAGLQRQLKEQYEAIATNDDKVKTRDEAIASKDEVIKEKDEQITAKEDEIKVNKEKILAAEDIVKAKEETIKAKDEKLAEVQGTLAQLQQEMQENESIRSKHHEALESNRDMMAMLKEQISKGLQKQKQQNSQINTLTSQISKLKSESQAKEEELQKKAEKECEAGNKELDELKAKVQELELENQDKEQLVCEANRAIEEYGDTQHDIKAKFKHLIQVYIHNITQSELQSSYKGDDSSLSIDGCFEQIQDALENQPDKSALLSYRNRADTAVAPAAAQPVAKLDPQAQQLLIDSHQKVDFAHQMILENHNEVQRITRQLQNAQKKITKYKACVTDLKSKLHRTAKALGEKNVQLGERQRRIENLNQQVECLKAENEKQAQRKGEESKPKKELLEQSVQTVSQARSDQMVQVDDAKQEIDKLKKEIETLTEAQKKQKKPKKKGNASMTSSNEDSDKSEQIEQLEEENMELLAKLQKTEKELQEARQKSEGKALFDDGLQSKEGAFEPVELSKEAKEKLAKIEEKIKELNTRLAVAVINVADEQIQKDVEESNNLMNKYEDHQEHKKDSNEESMRLESTVMQQRRDHITQIRGELKEAYDEMVECRAKLEKNADILDEKDLQSLKDDVQFFTAENHELTVKAKALVLKNNEQALKIKELSQKQQTVLKKSMINLDMSSIILDAIEQQTRKSDHLDFFYTANSGKQSSAPDVQDCEEAPHQQELAGDQMASLDANRNKAASSSGDSQNEHKKSEALTKSAITSVVTVDVNREGSDKNAVNTEESAETSSGDQQIRLSKIEKMIDEQQVHLDEGNQVQHSVRMLRQIQAELKSHVQALMKQQKPDNQKDGSQPEGSTQPDAGQQKKLEVNVDNSFDSSQSSGSDYKNVLEHVKSTLAIYLRKVPIIDVSNEMMLKIIFSMLKFSPPEVDELEAARKQLPVYVIDKKQSKKQQKELEANQKRTASQLASSQNSASQEPSENVTNGMSSKSQTLKKPNTPSGPKNKLIDMMKQSFTSKLQSSSALSSGSAKPKESHTDAQEYEGGTRHLAMPKHSSLPDQGQPQQNFVREAPAPLQRHAFQQSDKELDSMMLGAPESQNPHYQMKY